MLIVDCSTLDSDNTLSKFSTVKRGEQNGYDPCYVLGPLPPHCLPAYARGHSALVLLLLLLLL